MLSRGEKEPATQFLNDQITCARGYDVYEGGWAREGRGNGKWSVGEIVWVANGLLVVFLRSLRGNPGGKRVDGRGDLYDGTTIQEQREDKEKRGIT